MKKILLATVAVLMMAMLTACSETAEDAADTVVGLNDKVSDAETILGDYKETMSNVDATGEGTPNVQTNNTSLDDFVFEFGGVTIAPDMNTKEFLDKLGEPLHYYEVKSCAFEGMDKIYTYRSFEVSTYPNGTEDLVSYIYFKDDTVTTQEGAYIGMSKADVIALYGSDYTESAGMHVYESGGMELRFIFENDSVVSIEYATTVLDE
ncbi:MAG: membrane lipoprotein lipid attachment site-containing protein [Lachnospiraceae bacterium]|nr:membrane lipoprotein lipid attachment site-containing protein [Lachnospiraceae bacterium]MBQ7832917.1 membrane lipoprotein lipid attachment site-containing protein [Lachnospiraceae bacterium]